MRGGEEGGRGVVVLKNSTLKISSHWQAQSYFNAGVLRTFYINIKTLSCERSKSSSSLERVCLSLRRHNFRRDQHLLIEPGQKRTQ